MTKSSSIAGLYFLFVLGILFDGLHRIPRTDASPEEDNVCEDNVCQSNEDQLYRDSDRMVVDRQMCTHSQSKTEGKGSWRLFQRSTEKNNEIIKETDQPFTSIYRYGGTAQAFKPNVESSSTICDPELYRNSRHSVSNWSLFRWSSSSPPPVLNMKFTVFICEVDQKDQCACQTLDLFAKQNDSIDASVDIDVWQARPDGTFSSLRPGEEKGDCRGHAQLNTNDSHVELQTIAPGSYGSLGGIVPSASYDWRPFGPPMMHVAVSAPKIIDVPLLVDLSMSINSKTLEQQPTSLESDWRGASWMKKASLKSQPPPLRIKSWKPRTKENAVDIDIDIFLERKISMEDGSSTKDHATQVFCESWLYGWPSSFFLEPMAICGPSLLDFFAL